MKDIKFYIKEALKINSKSKVIRNDYEILFDSSEDDYDAFMNWMNSLNKKYPLFVLIKIPLENASEDDFYDVNTDIISIFNYCKNLLRLNHSNDHYLVKLNDGHIEVKHILNNKTYFIYILNHDGDDLYDMWDEHRISTENFIKDLVKYGIEKITK